ncbi:F-box DNA helicase 1 isoform X3 [Anolis carolinensis]|uniref:F-box DNA helicase 1 isoform X3 n=1 Tax=Anolis carolinensis TaxID=28377 RepID=UPI002F2B7784
MNRFKRRHLTNADCRALIQSREGISPLTQPFSQRPRSSQDPNRGLYPNCRSKKHPKGAGQYRLITDYFRKKPHPSRCSGNMSVSNKIKTEETTDPPLSTDEDSCSLLEDYESVPSTCPQASHNSDQWEQDDDKSMLEGLLECPLGDGSVKREVDDTEVNLLPDVCFELLRTASWEVPQGSINHMSASNRIKTEETADPPLATDEDSCSLLEGCEEPVVPSKRARISLYGDQWEQDDDKSLLEGLLECPLGDGSVEQKVDNTEIDPLPDACFGLLGTASWDVPQGSIDQLPDEVLQEIFALVPATDLFQSLSLVCQRWWRIIADHQFIPWKKLYHQYLKAQPEALLTVKAILQRYHLSKEQDECMLGFIRDPEAILECLKNHSLFPKADICIANRLPDLQDSKPEAPYSWAVMSAIVLLSGSVCDIQELVACLRRPSSTLSSIDIMEALYCMGTLLYAMRESDIRVSNRIHYNIFYCLYLLENSNGVPVLAVPEAASSSYGRGFQNSSRPALQPTCEQQQIINHAIAPKQVVKIMAFAGTGKTSTLVKYAEKWSNLRFLYLAFNKTIAEQGTRAFPPNVTSKTIHSLAFAQVGKNYSQQRKLNAGSLSSYWVSFVLQNRQGQSPFIRAKGVVQTLGKFFASADEAISLEHTPIWRKNNQGEKVLLEPEEKQIIISEANQIWTNMKRLSPTREMAYKMIHDGYLKLWQLQKPLLSDYDAILVDEAQDCTPAVMDIVLSQPCGVILVGDPHQQIYSFRGAVNAMSEVPHTHIYYLTQSFRFGAEIAYVGATILDVCKKIRNKTLVGGSQEGDVSGVGVTGKVARLSRNNQTIFEDAVNMTEGESPAKIYFLGGLNAFGLEKIHDVWKLLHPELGLEVKDSFLRRWVQKGFSALKDYMVKSEDKQLEMKIAIVEKYRDRIPELLQRITRHHTSHSEMADYVLGTVHKSKGLEFDVVQVANDFVTIPLAWHNLLRLPMFRIDTVPADEWNLLYVAVTRAKKRLVLPKFLSHLLTMAGEYFLRPELTSDVCKDGQVKCSVRGCLNDIPPESLLTMRKMPFVYSDGTADPESLLCHACLGHRLGPLAWLTVAPNVVEALNPAEEAIEIPQMVQILFEWI